MIQISGHSLGSHGALVMGLRNPEKFKSVPAFSPTVNPIQSPWQVKASTGYLGTEESTWAQYAAQARGQREDVRFADG